MTHQPLSGPATGAYITPPPPHPDDARDAALAVCELAHGPDDARLILDRLGLLDVLRQQEAA